MWRDPISNSTSARRWASAVLAVALAGLTLSATVAGADTTTTSAPAITTTLPATTTTTGPCAATPVVPQLVVSPTTFAPGDRVHASGSIFLEAACGVANGYSGPQAIYLLIDGHVFTFATVMFTDGTFDADLTVPATITAHGPGLLQYDPSPGSVPRVSVSVMSPIAPPVAVPATPELTG